MGLQLARLCTRKLDLVVNQRILMELYSAKLPLGLIKVIWQAVHEDRRKRVLRVALGPLWSARAASDRGGVGADAQTPHILTLVDRATDPVEVIYWPDVVSRIGTSGQPRV